MGKEKKREEKGNFTAIFFLTKEQGEMVRKYDFAEAENWIPEYEPPRTPCTALSKCVTEVCSVFSGEVNWISAVLREVSQPCPVCACGLECPAYFIQLWWDRSVEQLSLRRDNKHICYLLIPWLCLYTQDRDWIKAVFLVHHCREEKEPCRSHGPTVNVTYVEDYGRVSLI